MKALLVSALSLACLAAGVCWTRADQPDLEASRKVFVARCALPPEGAGCHTIDRPLQMRKTRERWEETVRRMNSQARLRQRPLIPEEDLVVIIDYLARERGPAQP